MQTSLSHRLGWGFLQYIKLTIHQQLDYFFVPYLKQDQLVNKHIILDIFISLALTFFANNMLITLDKADQIDVFSKYLLKWLYLSYNHSAKILLSAIQIKISFHDNYNYIFYHLMKNKIDFKEVSRHMYTQVSDMQVFQKAYLRPIQILLRTYKIDKLLPNDQRTSLPQGLMIASKQSIHQRSYIPIHLQFRGPKTLQRYQKPEVSQYHRKNLLNLLKKVNTKNVEKKDQNGNDDRKQMIRSSVRQKNREEHIPFPTQFQIAICVCVYSENAGMLKQTVACIKQNIISLVKTGVRQDSIGVFIFFDGIQKMDASVLQYLSLIESLQINLRQGSSNTHTAFDDFHKASNIDESKTDYSKTQAYSKLFNRYQSMIIFSQQQLKDRKERTINQVHKRYTEIVKLKNKIEKLKVRPNIGYEMLPDRVRDEFLQLAKKHKDYENRDNEYILFDLLYKNIEGQKAICIEALASTEDFCNTYLNSKKDLVYLSMRRQLIYSSQHAQAQLQQYLTDQCKKKRDGAKYIPFNLSRQSQDQSSFSTSFFRKSRQHIENITKIHMNLFYCVKYKNEGKLSSHNWFFNGFCKELNPHYVILVDVGLKAKDNSIFSMYHHLKGNKNLGGVCGYMGLKIQKKQDEDQVNQQDVGCLTNFAHMVVDIQRAQQVQYHFAHLLDKPFQSLFKFIHVLPGAFSGYNMLAIHSPDDKQELILRKYFESLNEKIAENHIVQTEITFKWLAVRIFLPDFANSFFLKIDPDSEQQLLCNENMNLAEDRILCFGIHKNGYDLAYLPDCFSEVDPIKNLHSMLGQRKRWINGSYFAFEKVKQELDEFLDHKNDSQLFLKLQMLYLTLVNSVSYFSVSLFLFTFNISMRVFYQHILEPIFSATFVSKQVIPYFINTMVFIFVFFIFTVIYYSLNLTYNNSKFKKLIYLSSTIIGIFSIIVAVVLIVDLSNNSTNNAPFLDVHADPQKVDRQQFLTSILRLIILSMFTLHAIPVIIHSIMYKKFQIIVEVVLGVVSFLFYNPTYLIIFNIYALCRMDDISWGTKGRDQEQSFNKKLKDKWRLIKFVHVFKYLFWNTFLSCVFLNIEFDYQTRIVVTLSIMAIITIILGIKLILGLAYSICYKATAKQIKIENKFDKYNFKSQIFEQMTQQKWSQLTQDTILSNISSMIAKQLQRRIRSSLNRNRNVKNKRMSFSQ